MTRALAATLVALCACGADDVAPEPDAFVELWATYAIEPGQHDATISGGTDDNPLRGFQTIAGRDYQLAFDPSAAYVLTQPTDPDDQLDWNKLPGLSDCGTIDLAVDGAMFGWRWRVDLAPPVLEVTAYANATRVHQWPPDPLFALSADELAADAPLRYRVWPDGDVFRFAVTGAIGARVIDVTAELPRACPATPVLDFKWAAGLYFGGTSVAPSRISARVSERAFAR
ncbi:MAG TPA: hypothetical protein VM261_00570 [Kofleriaceae bacterium]|nr:hypothetical protein [Kofleriaceae bacterium]